jgi:hypothetical protein
MSIKSVAYVQRKYCVRAIRVIRNGVDYTMEARWGQVEIT